MPTGAEAIVAQLEAEGVRVAFGRPPARDLPMWDALRGSRIRLAGVRDERAAAHAADGYARATGRLGVMVTTTGFGAANALPAVGEAWAARSPVLLVAAHVAGAPDLVAMFTPVVATAHVVRTAAHLLPGARAATVDPVRLRRPVYLEVPADLLAEEAAPEPPGRGWTSSYGPPEGDEHRAHALVDAAERPLIWAGGGARDRREEVAQLAERLAAPVLTTANGSGVLPPGHPCRVGMPPHVPPAGKLWDEADVVIAFGTDLDAASTQNHLQPQPPRLVAVNVDSEDARTHYRTDAVVYALRPERLRDRSGELAALTQRVRAVRAEACRALDDDALSFLDAVSYALPEDAVVACDASVAGMWIAGFHGFARPRLLQVPAGYGTDGYAFPAALGAALAGNGPAVSISAAGGFLRAAGELAELAGEEIPLTAVIVGDEGATPDLPGVARSLGVRAEAVEDLAESFGEALAEHVADPAPSVLVARAPALPPPPTSPARWYRAHPR